MVMRRRSEAVQVSLQILEECHWNTPGVSRCHGKDPQRQHRCEGGGLATRDLRLQSWPVYLALRQGWGGIDLDAVGAIWIVKAGDL